jgi:hypothetical protein
MREGASSNVAGRQNSKPAVETDKRLVSVSVRLERNPLDGTVRLIEVNESGRQDQENQAVLVLNQSLWLKVSRPT